MSISFTLGTFIVSGVILVLMIVLKAVQDRAGILLFWPEMRHKSEVALKEQRQKVRQMSDAFSRRNMYIVMHFVLTKIRNVFTRIQHKLDERSHPLVRLIKGRQILDSTKQQNRASHFLHDVTRFKDRFKKH
jgi:hypothetical protein